MCVVRDNRQEIMFVQCMQVYAAGWSGRSNATAGWFPASVNNYAESVISVSPGDEQLHTCERAYSLTELCSDIYF